jgi:hypothetical protein
MVVVYLKNGEKAPMPDANYVKLESVVEGATTQVLRCFFGNAEVGHFKWEEVAGYTVSSVRAPNLPGGSYDAWNQRMEGERL